MTDIATFDFTLRYQRTPGAQYHVRPLSLLQQDVLYRCDGTVTVADLADMTLYSHPEIAAVLSFLLAHGLVKTLMPEAWLFHHPAQNTHSPVPIQTAGHIRRFLHQMKLSLQNRLDRFWFKQSLSAPTGPQPWLMEHEQVVISVWNLRCMVSRWEWSDADGSYVLARASNANELEAEARHAVEAQGGASNISGIYTCPPELAAKAVFA